MPSHVPKYGNFFEFHEEDLIYNRIKTYPQVNFFIYSGSVYYNNENQSGSNSNTPNGYVSLYELNVNRSLHATSDDSQLIFPFIAKEGSFTSFKTIDTESFNHDFAYGDTIAKNYPMTASISVNRYPANFSSEKKRVLYALKTSLDFHSYLCPRYAYSSSYGDKELQKLNIISVPSIFYGSSIEKGSVTLKYYISGSLLAEASDTKRNGELIQTSGSTTGDSVGVVLYNEGFIILTSSTNLGTHTEVYEPINADGSTPSAVNVSWHYFASTSSATQHPSSSFKIDFKGTNYIDTITMFAHAEERSLNFSNNPTFLSHSITATSASNYYSEDDKSAIANIVSSSYPGYSASFEPITYISKIGIYDENRNLIAIAGLANPVKKTEDRSFTFKLKLDI